MEGTYWYWRRIVTLQRCACMGKDTMKRRLRRKVAGHYECSNTATLTLLRLSRDKEMFLLCNGTNYQMSKNRNSGSRCSKTNVCAIEISGTVSPYGLSSAAGTVEWCCSRDTRGQATFNQRTLDSESSCVRGTGIMSKAIQVQGTERHSSLVVQRERGERCRVLKAWNRLGACQA
jgi:hypothetical protein